MAWFFLGAALLTAIVVLFYNRMVKQTNRLREAESGIDVQLKRRHELVPNLVETVKGYALHEKKLFIEVAEKRSACLKAASISEKVPAEAELASGIKSLFALAENYPDLKASDNFKKLQEQLFEVEDHLQYARRYYNGTVRDLNNMLETFPGLIFAGIFNFKKGEFFGLSSEDERAPVKADLGGGR